jgi:hypothetical protein
MSMFFTCSVPMHACVGRVGGGAGRNANARGRRTYSMLSLAVLTENSCILQYVN